MPSGHFDWLRLPMGLPNSPLAFQRMINSFFSGVIGNCLFVCLEDLIVFSKDIYSHWQKLELVFHKLT